MKKEFLLETVRYKTYGCRTTTGFDTFDSFSLENVDFSETGVGVGIGFQGVFNVGSSFDGTGCLALDKNNESEIKLILNR